MGELVNLDQYRIERQNKEAANQDTMIDSEGNIMPRTLDQFYQDVPQKTLDDEMVNDTRDKLNNIITQVQAAGEDLMGRYLDVLMIVSPEEDYVSMKWDTYLILVDKGLVGRIIPEITMQNGVRMIKVRRKNLKEFRATLGA